MAINWSIEQSVDLTRGAQDPQVWPDALLVQGDENAHTWRVAIRIGGKPAAIAGTVTGYFIRADNYMVPVEGILEGSTADVAAIPLDPPLKRTLGMALRSEREATPAMLRLIDCAKGVLGI